MARGLRLVLRLFAPPALLGLAGCGAFAGADAAAVAPQPVDDGPQLWLVETLGGGRAVTGSTFVCADPALRASFLGAATQVDGEPCEDMTSARRRDYAWTLRCRAGGRGFTVGQTTLGDLEQDYRLDIALTPDPQAAGASVVRVALRLRRVGECPAGWRVGDHARPGQRPERRRSKA